VLVLGDSFAYGVGVEDDASFSARLEALNPALEVLNAGVNGYATSHELLLLREVGLAVQPDLVLLAFFWNDVTEAWRKPSPPFTLQDGRLVDPLHGPDDPPPSAWPDPNRRPWLHDSRARRFLKDRAYRARWRLRVALGIAVDEPTGLDVVERARAWELCFALLREMSRRVRSTGAHFAIAVIPDQVQVYPELERTVLGIDDADIEVQAPLAAFARAEGIPFLDLLPPLREARAADPDTLLYYAMDRHLTAEGHRIVSDALGSSLRSLGLLRRAPRAAPGSPQRPS
jgi:lysophospholipase L1-like esterase